MAIGIADIKLTLSDKEFKTGMSKAVNSVKAGIGSMKTMLLGAALGQYLFAGANDAIDAAVRQVKTKMNLADMGFSDEQIDPVMKMAESFELMGYNAEQAGNTIAELIVSGKALGMKSIGVYLTKEEQAFITAASSAERYAWVMENLPSKLQGMHDMLPDQIESFIEMRTTKDDLKEALGSTFLTVIQKITDAFGGIVPAMKTAIIAFTAYKTAMILGNVGIGISKAIATGSVFAAPAAIAMGAAALASIGAMIGGAGLAISSLNAVDAANQAATAGSTSPTAPAINPPTVVIVKDKYGETQKALGERNGGNGGNIQTSYGGK